MRRACRGVLLDFDGTLTKPFFNWPAMRREMGFGSEAVSVLDFLAAAPGASAAQVARILDRHEAEAARRAQPNEGAAELLDFLRQGGVPFAVVTNNAMRHVARALERMGLAVENIITREIGCWKPDPRQALAGAEAIGVPPGRCVFIGDGRLDMLAARGAGMTSVLLATGPGPECDFRIEGLGEAIPLLARLLGGGGPSARPSP